MKIEDMNAKEQAQYGNAGTKVEFPSEFEIAAAYSNIIDTAAAAHANDTEHQKNTDCTMCQFAEKFHDSEALKSIFLKVTMDEMQDGSTPGEITLILTKIFFALGYQLGKQASGNGTLPMGAGTLGSFNKRVQ